MRVVILHDEMSPDSRPDELDALVQADVVSQSLRELGHESARLAITLDLIRTAESLRELRPDCVFNLVESVAGNGRLIYLATALLDSLGLPYTGVGTEAMFVTSSKTLCKKVLAAQGIPTPRWFTPQMLVGDTTAITGRYIIKSVWEEASIGLDDDSVKDFRSSSELLTELRLNQPRLGGSAFAEEYIDGREFNLSILGNDNGVQVMPPAEIEFVNYSADKPRIVGYNAKWRDDSPEYHDTPRRFDFAEADRAMLAELMTLTRRCWDLLGLRGYARVDFRVDEQGHPWVLEVNANPCLSPDAGFMAATEHAGLTMTEVVRRLIENAMKT